MGLSVTFVSGLRCSGKSTLIRGMIDRLWKAEPHYIRLVKTDSDKARPKPTSKPPPKCGVASARWLEYDDEHIFEILPEALAAIHKGDRYGSVVLEADADASLRHAYPYDHRVFVMAMPPTIETVFRNPRRAAKELQRVLDDTASFASEVFGLFSDPAEADVDPPEQRSEMTDAGMRGFLYSPLGDEIVTRIQLQQAYHGLVESDVVVVNTSIGVRGQETTDCLTRLERLLSRTSDASGRRSELFLCDPHDYASGDCRKLLKALAPMCLGGQ